MPTATSQTSNQPSSDLPPNRRISIVNGKSRNNGKGQPHLVKRGDVYYFRMAIPKDLSQAFPHREIKRSLRTSDTNAARVLASAYEREAQGLFASLRAKVLIIPTIDSASVVTTAVPAVPAIPTGPTFREVIGQYVKERKQRWTRRTELEFTSALDLLLAILGNKSLSHILRSDCVSCRDQLLAGKGRREGSKGKPRSVKTVNQYLCLISSVFKWAVGQRLMDRNPAEGLTTPLKVKSSEQRKAYSLAQLQSVISHLPDPEGDHPERYWIPVIALYSGLRLEEIAQLRLDRLVTIDGVTCFDIDGDHLKTATSKRLVPVHAQLLKLGLVGYVERIQKAAVSSEDQDYLFPQLSSDRHGRRGRYVGEWYGKFLRKKVGLTDPRVTFHSLRHTFATALKHAGTDGPMLAELLGYTMRGQTFGRYAKSYPPAMLREAIGKIALDMNWGVVAKQNIP